jgi:lipopolysaccharide biosynthesis protein
MKKIAVCLQLYHTDLWPEFERLLVPYSDYIKLYVALCEDSNFEEIPHASLRDSFLRFDHHVSYHENYGADIAPFLHQLQLVEEDYFIKIHGKKSRFGKNNQVNWRAILLHDFFGSEEVFNSNLETISNNNCGMICNPSFLLQNKEDNNSSKIEHLCQILDMNYKKVQNSKFAAGSMFLSKTKLFQDKLNDKFFEIDSLLKKESGNVSLITSGSYSHSLERIFGYIIEEKELEFCFPKHEIIKIVNEKAPNKEYFNLVKVYNDECYIIEDPSLFGEYSEIEDGFVEIDWKHVEQKYKYTIIDKNKILNLKFNFSNSLDINNINDRENSLKQIKKIFKNISFLYQKSFLAHSSKKILKKNIKKILYVFESSLGQCVRYRILQKIEQFKIAGIKCNFIPCNEYKKILNNIIWYDCIVFYKNTSNK